MVLNIIDSDKRYLSIFNEYNKIVPGNAIFIAGVGSQKSVTLESIAEQYHESGCVVIFITDVKDKSESAYPMFFPNEAWHIQCINRDAENVFRQPKNHKVKLWHPFTFSIPKKNMPKMRLFTMPIKSLGEEEISILVESKSSSDDVQLFFNCIRELNNKQGLSDLLYLASRKIKPKHKVLGTKVIREPDPNNFNLDAPLAGNSKTISDLSTFFRPFFYDNHYCLSSNDCSLAFDPMEIYKEPDKYHVLLTKYVKNEANVKNNKIADFIQYYFFKTIVRNSDKCKKPIVFIIEEANKWLPASTKGYKEFLINVMGSDLKIIRSKTPGFVTILSAQSYRGVDDSIVESISADDKYPGKSSSQKDVMAILGERTSSEKIKQIEQLSTGEFVKYNEGEGIVFKFLTPQHMHAETNYDFEDIYRKHYDTVDYTDTFELMSNYKKEEQTRVNELALKAYDNVAQQITTIENRKKEQKIKQLSSQIQQIKIDKPPMKGVTWEMAEEWKRLHIEESKSYAEIAKQYNLMMKDGKPYAVKIEYCIKKVMQKNN